VQQAESLGSYGAEISDDYASYTAASVMVETADRVTDDDGGGVQQYLLLVGALRSLARREHPPGLTLDSYLLRSLSIAGWAPSFGQCAVTGAPGPHDHFVVQLGGMVAATVAPPGSPRVSRETLELLAALITGDWVTADASEERARNQASGLIAAFTQFHLERGLRSLPHVDRQVQSSPVSRRAAAAPELPAEHPTPSSTTQDNPDTGNARDTPTIGARA
jgi:DNA repair protein RecO (recombination protein O)